ncbi:hypothetical protein FOZ60_016506 [Perkinsus olseni]|uniref:Uncharacterized protein n=1 Tax=Perkinsus olseni TaxID=32597 RepID=A0A7J6N4T2_PEROL|nr:hypothetical protein FOZ60_016506 [Perkinsus olseni]
MSGPSLDPTHPGQVPSTHDDPSPPLAINIEETIVYPAGPVQDQADIIEAQSQEIMALRQRITALEEEKSWMEWTQKTRSQCKRCSTCPCTKKGVVPLEEKSERAAGEGDIPHVDLKCVEEETSRTQARAYLWTWAENGDASRRQPCDAESATSGKGLLFYSVFFEYEQGGNRPKAIHFITKYRLPRRWKQVAERLRDDWAVEAFARVPAATIKRDTYQLLFVHCYRRYVATAGGVPLCSPHHPALSQILPESLLPKLELEDSLPPPALEVGFSEIADDEDAVQLLPVVSQSGFLVEVHSIMLSAPVVASAIGEAPPQGTDHAVEALGREIEALKHRGLPDKQPTRPSRSTSRYSLLSGIDVLEEEKRWMQWRLDARDACEKCSRCACNKEEDASETLEESRYEDCFEDCLESNSRRYSDAVSLLDDTVLYADEESASDEEGGMRSQELSIAGLDRGGSHPEQGLAVDGLLGDETFSFAGMRLPVELRVAEKGAQLRVYIWDWPQTLHPDRLYACHISKRKLAEIVLAASNDLTTKGHSECHYHLAIFYHYAHDSRVHCRFIIKHWAPRRWWKVAQTLKTVYGIYTNTLQPTGGLLNYEVLLSRCLLIDPEPYLSPGHPPLSPPILLPTRHDMNDS